MVELIGDDGHGCAMLDSCIPQPLTVAGTYNLLMRNFQDHYNGNRAPFGLHLHAGWINGSSDGNEVEERRRGYDRFVDFILGLGDVYIVSVSKGIEWIKTPKDLSEVKDFAPFKVAEKQGNQCPKKVSCHYKAEQTPFPSER